ncbi:MAG: hypothetical protein IKL01_01855, partial [Mailhella sp.]|nr:hypothetical protein [Mailhella sp.]
MKKLTALLALIFCLATAIPAQAGCIAGKEGDVFASFPEVATPFGAKMGMPGKAFPELRHKEVTSRETFVVRSVPKPSPLFDLYLLTFEDDGRSVDGLSSICGAVIFRKGEHGLSEFFAKQTKVFQKHYGDPSYFLNEKWIRFLRERRPECDELKKALFADRRGFVAAWDFKGRPDGLRRVQVEFFPQSEDECWGVTSFYFENYK